MILVYRCKKDSDFLSRWPETDPPMEVEDIRAASCVLLSSTNGKSIRIFKRRSPGLSGLLTPSKLKELFDLLSEETQVVLEREKTYRVQRAEGQEDEIGG